MAMSLASMMMFSVFSRHGSDYKCATGYTGALKKNRSEWQRDYFGLLHFNDWKLLVALDSFYYETYHFWFSSFFFCTSFRTLTPQNFGVLPWSTKTSRLGSEVWSYGVVGNVGPSVQDLRSEVAPWSRTAATRPRFTTMNWPMENFFGWKGAVGSWNHQSRSQPARFSRCCRMGTSRTYKPYRESPKCSFPGRIWQTSMICLA